MVALDLEENYNQIGNFTVHYIKVKKNIFSFMNFEKLKTAIIILFQQQEERERERVKINFGVGERLDFLSFNYYCDTALRYFCILDLLIKS